MSVAIRQALHSTAAPRALSVRRSIAPTRVRTRVRHLTLPFHEIAHVDLREGETVDALVRRTGWATRVKVKGVNRWSFRLPTICVVNGAPILQRAWRRLRLRATDAVEFWSKPLGGGGSGGGKQVLGLLAVIALAAFAPWAGGALAGALGLGSVAGSIISGLITIGGSLLISALTTPKATGPGDAVDQLYSISASGNTARLLQPITVQYGRVKSFPDYAITPWSEFDGNDQYLNVLLSVGLGKHSYENLFIDDTILWDSVGGVSDTFTDVQVAFYDPGAQIALFPTNVTQADEVSGQQLTTDWIGGFVANAAGSLAKALAVDLVFPAGCFSADGSGISSSSVTIIVQARPIDDAGAPIGLGTWTELYNQTLTYTTRNPVRLTIKEIVASARYEVRVMRTDDQIADNTGANAVEWAGLRAFIDAPSSFPVSTVAIRIKANAQITDQTARKFGVLCTRILPVWDTDSQTFIEQPTRSPAWAFYDAATDTVYGAGRPPSKVDFQGVFDLATAAAARDDAFDYRFSSAVMAPDAFDTTLRGTRVRHRWSGDVLTVVRDEWSDTPRMLLTDREIARGSLSLDYSLNTDDSADAVIVQYLDQGTWGPGEVQYPPNSDSFTAINPTRVRLDGIVSRSQAYREAAFYYLQSQYRRIRATLDTEHDGRMLGFGSRVRLQTELPQTWGATGVVSNNASGTLTLSPAPSWTGTGSFYIAIRNKTGRQFGPVLCFRGASDALAVLDADDLAAVEGAQGTTLGDALTRRDGAEDPSFDFGVSDMRARSCLVLSGRPNGDRVTLTLAVDNEAVHETDLGDIPVAPTLPALRDPTAPVIAALTANFRQGVAEPILDVSWQPAPGAVYYAAEVSYDGGSVFTPVYEGHASKFSAVVDYAALRLRVQGVGERQGGWYTIDVAAPDIHLAPGIVDQTSLDNTLDAIVSQVKDRIPEIIQALRDDFDTLVSAQQGAVAQRVESEGRIFQGLGQQIGDTRAEITQVSEIAVTTQSAFAAIFNDVVATTDGGGTAESLLQIAASSDPLTGAIALISLAVRAGRGGDIAEAAMELAAVDDPDLGLQSRVRFLANNVDFIVNGKTLRAALFVQANEPTNVPIVGGYVQVDLTGLESNFTTALDSDVTMRMPIGGWVGYKWTHSFVQDAAGSHAVNIDAAIYFTGPITVFPNATYYSSVECEIVSLNPPKAKAVMVGGGNTSLGDATSFAISPPVNGYSTWDTAVDGPLEIDGAGDWIITPLGDDLSGVTFDLTGPSAGSGGVGPSATAGTDGDDTTFAGIMTAGGGKGSPGVVVNDSHRNPTGLGGLGGTATGGDTNTPGNAGAASVYATNAPGTRSTTGAGGQAPSEATLPPQGGTYLWNSTTADERIDGTQGNAPGNGASGALVGDNNSSRAALGVSGGSGSGAECIKTFAPGVLLKGVPYTLHIGTKGTKGTASGTTAIGPVGGTISFAFGADGTDGRAIIS